MPMLNKTNPNMSQNHRKKKAKMFLREASGYGEGSMQ